MSFFHVKLLFKRFIFDIRIMIITIYIKKDYVKFLWKHINELYIICIFGNVDILLVYVYTLTRMLTCIRQWEEMKTCALHSSLFTSQSRSSFAVSQSIGFWERHRTFTNKKLQKKLGHFQVWFVIWSDINRPASY